MVSVFLLLGYFRSIPFAFSGVGVISWDDRVIGLPTPAETGMLIQICLHEFIIFVMPGAKLAT